MYFGGCLHYNSINEMGIGVEYRYGSNALHASVGCYFPLKNNVQYYVQFIGEDLKSPYQMIGQFGPTIQLKSIFNANNNLKNVFGGFLLDGSYLHSTTFISDPETSNRYSEFKDQMWMLGFAPALHLRIADQTPCFFTIESGLNLKFIERHYSLERNAYGVNTSNRIEHINTASFVLRFGIVYIFHEKDFLAK